jgi:hypothetical protein
VWSDDDDLFAKTAGKSGVMWVQTAHMIAHLLCNFEPLARTGVRDLEAKPPCQTKRLINFFPFPPKKKKIQKKALPLCQSMRYSTVRYRSAFGNALGWAK